MGEQLDYRKESRRSYYTTEGMTAEKLIAGSLMRIADSIEQIEGLANGFPGCDAARALIRISERGIVIRREFVLRIGRRRVVRVGGPKRKKKQNATVWAWFRSLRKAAK